MIECVGSPRFCTLSTIDENGKPWGAPLFYSWDADGNIYWTSAVRAQHSINIARTSDAYITILSDKPDPTNVGRNCVYLSGHAFEITDIDEVVRARNLLCERMKIESKNPETFLGDSPRRVYVFHPEKAWCDGVESVNAADGGVHDCDVRVVL